MSESERITSMESCIHDLEASRQQDAAKVDDLHGRIQQLCDGSDALVADLKIAQARIAELENLAIDTGWQLTAARAERDALLAGARAAGYQSGMHEEREHQNALSRLVMEKHKEELLVAGAGWETIDPSCLRYNLGAASWRLDGIAFDLAEFPENMRLQRRVATSEDRVTEDA